VIPPETAVGKVRLRVADADRLAEFYERVLGLRAQGQDGGVLRLGPEGGKPLVELESAPAAPRRPAGASPAPPITWSARRST
jgi:catechol-2,3-dioxygenase